MTSFQTRPLAKWAVPGRHPGIQQEFQGKLPLYGMHSDQGPNEIRVGQNYTETLSTGDPAINLQKVGQMYTETVNTGDPAGNLQKVGQLYIEILHTQQLAPQNVFLSERHYTLWYEPNYRVIQQNTINLSAVPPVNNNNLMALERRDLKQYRYYRVFTQQNFIDLISVTPINNNNLMALERRDLKQYQRSRVFTQQNLIDLISVTPIIPNQVILINRQEYPSFLSYIPWVFQQTNLRHLLAPTPPVPPVVVISSGRYLTREDEEYEKALAKLHAHERERVYYRQVAAKALGREGGLIGGPAKAAKFLR